MGIVRVGTSSPGGGTENLGEAVEVEEGVCQGQVIQRIGGLFEQERSELKVFRPDRTTY